MKSINCKLRGIPSRLPHLRTVGVLLALFLFVGTFVATVQAQDQAPQRLPAEMSRELDDLTKQGCDCYVQHGDLADKGPYQECLVSVDSQMQDLISRARSANTSFTSMIYQRLEAAQADCEKAAHNRPLNEERRARMRVAFHTEFQQKVTASPMQRIADEIGSKQCDCANGANAAHTLPCEDELEIMTALLQMRYSEQPEVYQEAQHLISKQLAACTGQPMPEEDAPDGNEQ